MLIPDKGPMHKMSALQTLYSDHLLVTSLLKIDLPLLQTFIIFIPESLTAMENYLADKW